MTIQRMVNYFKSLRVDDCVGEGEGVWESFNDVPIITFSKTFFWKYKIRIDDNEGSN